MSTSYTDLTTLYSGQVLTPADNARIGSICTKNYPFHVTSITAVIDIAATTNAQIELVKGSTTIATIGPVTTAAAGTEYETKVAEADRLVDAGEKLYVKETLGGDATVKYSFAVHGTYNWQ